MARGIQIAETIGLKSVGQNSKHEMARQVRGRSTPERIVPTGLKAAKVEIAQARDLDFESIVVRQGRTNLHTGHVRSGCSALRLRRVRLLTV